MMKKKYQNLAEFYLFILLFINLDAYMLELNKE